MFLVVEFGERCEVAVVSAGWLSKDESCVFWPPYKSQKKVDALVQSDELPDDNWSRWVVKRIMYRTDDFATAVRKLRMAEEESDLQTDAEQPSVQKRKKRPNPRFLDSESDSESHDDDDVFPPPPKKTRLTPRPSSVPPPLDLQAQPTSSSVQLDLPSPSAPSTSSLSLPSVMSSPSSSRRDLSSPPPCVRPAPSSLSSSSSPLPSVMSVQSPPPVQRHLSSPSPAHSTRPSPSSSFLLNLPSPSALSRSSPLPSVMPVQSPPPVRRHLSSPAHSTRPSSTPPPSKQRSSSLTSNVIPERDIRLFRVLEDIREEVKETKAMVASIAQQMRADVRDSPLPEGISLPLGSEEELRDMEERLEDPVIFKMMVAHLSSIGGSSVKVMTKRLMKAIIRNELALEFNWTGAKNKSAFGTLRLTLAIQRAVRRIYPASGNSETEFHIKDWLRNAKDRDGGRKKRMRTSTSSLTSDDEL